MQHKGHFTVHIYTRKKYYKNVTANLQDSSWSFSSFKVKKYMEWQWNIKQLLCQWRNDSKQGMFFLSEETLHDTEPQLQESLRLSQDTCVSVIWTYNHKLLHLQPYKFNIVNKLHQADWTHFYNCFCETGCSDEVIPERTYFTCETGSLKWQINSGRYFWSNSCIIFWKTEWWGERVQVLSARQCNHPYNQ
jgi:hypothetical protein